MQKLSIPIPDKAIRKLKVGDPVSLSGVMLTGRDAAHKWMVETFVKGSREPQGDDREVYQPIKPFLDGGAIYHCGPVVAGLETGEYRFVAAGPTTSTRLRQENNSADGTTHPHQR
jgi:fumarate hydratase class I